MIGLVKALRSEGVAEWRSIKLAIWLTFVQPYLPHRLYLMDENLEFEKLEWWWMGRRIYPRAPKPKPQRRAG